MGITKIVFRWISKKSLRKRTRPQTIYSWVTPKLIAVWWKHFFAAIKSNAPLIAIFCISLAVNLFVLMDYSKSPFSKIPVWDADIYWKWAQRIAAGDFLGNTIFHQTPLYPYFLSLILLIFGKTLAPIYIVQAILGACSALLVCSITKRVSEIMGAGFISGILFAFYGMQVFYNTKILSECLSVFLLLLTTRLLLAETFSRKLLITAGTTTGLLLIAKPHLMLAVPLTLLYLSFLEKHQHPNPRCLFTKLIQFLLPVIVLIAIVAMRNYAVGGDFVLISSNGGENFYIGNHKNAGGVYAPVEGISQDIEYQNEDVNALAEQKTGYRMKRSEVSSYWFRQGVAFILHHQKEYLKLEWTKLMCIFSGAERSTMYHLYFEKKNITKSYSIPLVNFYLLFPLFLSGFLLALLRWKRYVIVFAFLLVNMLNILVFFFDTRFMLLVMPYWIILGGVAAWNIGKSVITAGVVKTLLRPVSIFLIFATALTAFIYSSDAKVKKPDGQMYLALGYINLNLNDLDAALKAYSQSSCLNMNDWMPAFGVSQVLYRKGNKKAAAQLYNDAFRNLSDDFKKLVLRDNDLNPIREYIVLHESVVSNSLPKPAVPVGLDNPHP